MGNPDDLTENEKELIEAMKSPPAEGEEVRFEDEGDEGQEFTEDEGPARDDKGRFAKKEADDPGPESEPEKAAEPAPESKAEPDKDKLPDRMVPIQALDSERKRRQESDGENAQLRQQVAALEQRMAALTQPQQPAQQQDDIPDPITNEAGFKAWLLAQQEAAQRPYREMRERAAAAQRQEQEFATISNYTAQHEAAFRQQYPDNDYDGALDHAVKQVAHSLRMMGYSDADIPELVRRQQVETARMAYERGINPAAYVWNYAIQTGYRPVQKQDADGANVTRLAEVQQRTKSTASASGSARSDEITPEYLSRLSDAEFQRVYDKNPEAVARALGA